MSDEIEIFAKLAVAQQRIQELEQKLERSVDGARSEDARLTHRRILKRFLESVDRLGVCFDQNGCVIYVNSLFVEMTGWQESEVLEKNRLELFMSWKFMDGMPLTFSPHNFSDTVKEGVVFETDILTKLGKVITVTWFSFFSEEDQLSDIICLGILKADLRYGHSVIQRMKFDLSLVDLLPLSIMVFDEYGFLTFVNRFYLEEICQNQFAAARFVGRSVFDLPEIVSSCMSYKVALLLKGFPFFMEKVHVFQTVGKNMSWQSIKGVPFLYEGTVQGGILIIEDISERVQVEQSLVEEHQRLQIIADNTYAWEYWKGTDGHFKWVSPSCEKLTGFPPEYFTGESPIKIRDLIHPEDLDRWVAHHDEVDIFSSDRREIDFRIVNPDGETLWVSHICKPVFDDQGKYLGRRGCNHNITERKKVELDLIEAKQAAEAASVIKTEFISNMSHEIRTPFNGILGMLQLLQLSELNSQQREYCDLAEQSAFRMTALLSNLLDISSIESGKLRLESRNFALKEVVGQLLDMYLPVSKQTGVEVVMNYDSTIPEWVVGDFVRLQQVLTNVIGNAFKFTSSGTVTVDVCRSAPAEAGVRILFVVTDTGCGIPDDIVGNLFEPFVQASRGYSRSHQGAGLGLSICKRIVAMMGGNMSVSSVDGAGTEMYCSIPFKFAGGLSH